MNGKTKEICRRVIRVLMVLVGVLLLVAGLIVPVVNNGIALGLERELKELPLPENTRSLDSFSAAGRYDGTGEDVRYFGAVLVESEGSLADLRAYYAALSPECTVEKQIGAGILPVGNGTLSFSEELFADGEAENRFIVYILDRSAHTGQGWLNLDVRG